MWWQSITITWIRLVWTRRNITEVPSKGQHHDCSTPQWYVIRHDNEEVWPLHLYPIIGKKSPNHFLQDCLKSKMSSKIVLSPPATSSDNCLAHRLSTPAVKFRRCCICCDTSQGVPDVERSTFVAGVGPIRAIRPTQERLRRFVKLLQTLSRLIKRGSSGKKLSLSQNFWDLKSRMKVRQVMTGWQANHGRGK
jgi:hypothetical protein